MAKSIECYDITECDWNSKTSMAKYFFTGKFMSCFNLAQEWAPEAVQAAKEGLDLEYDSHQESISCASQVAKKMGATDEEMVMVAGFAGGLGLSGNACGALSAVIWMKTLNWYRQDGKTSFNNPYAEEAIEKFYAVTDYEMLCEKISGRTFESVKDHTYYLKNDGCYKLIDTLAQL